MSYKVIGYVIASTTRCVTSFKIASSIMHNGHVTRVGSVLTSPLSTRHMLVLVGEKLLGSGEVFGESTATKKSSCTRGATIVVLNSLNAYANLGGGNNWRGDAISIQIRHQASKANRAHGHPHHPVPQRHEPISCKVQRSPETISCQEHTRQLLHTVIPGDRCILCFPPFGPTLPIQQTESILCHIMNPEMS